LGEVVFMKKKQVLIPILLAIVIAGGSFGIKMLLDLKTYREQVNAISISDVDLDRIGDGIYTGRHEVLWISAEVRVTVKNHRIEDIALIEHRNGKGKPAEAILYRVLAAQSLDVDAVSGATNSSKVILKAIENALKKY